MSIRDKIAAFGGKNDGSVSQSAPSKAFSRAAPSGSDGGSQARDLQEDARKLNGSASMSSENGLGAGAGTANGREEHGSKRSALGSAPSAASNGAYGTTAE